MAGISDSGMKIHAFTVLPHTPDKLKHLKELAFNLWFSWNTEARLLFRSLDKDLWRLADHNPVRMLCIVPEEKLEKAASDFHYLAELEAVYERFRRYLDDKAWFAREYGVHEQPLVAYFCAEFGLHECLPVYSGGLGVLAGDHVKTASDLGVPMVGVGLLYRQGYLRQYLNADGMQQERYPDNDWYNMPVHLVQGADGKPVRCCLEVRGEPLYYQIWRVDVGRVVIYLLDTNLPENTPRHREITVRLYDPDRDLRICQEILLGVGGVQALRTLGIAPQVYHCNEGHSAFLSLERIRLLMQDAGLSLAEAREVTWATTVFTTHTPVPAGNERFHPELVRHYLSDYATKLGLSWKEFLGLGRVNPEDNNEEFCMTVLAIKLSAFVNGVSRLHGRVSRRMWQGLFPGIALEEIPIGHITNGVHSKSWINQQLRNLFERYVTSTRQNGLGELNLCNDVDAIPDNDLWNIHQHCKRELIEFVRRSAEQHLARRGASATEVNAAKRALDPDVLTIGFARRFATYKRPYLLLSDLTRLGRLVQHAERPLQLIFAGKAHPADQEGKEMIRHIVEFARRPEMRSRVVFLEDYDLSVARRMVQGVDVWLNTPRRDHEASGTSGMKAAMNGVLNLSVPDGWWDEAYQPEVGWAVGMGESYTDWGHQDHVESELLYYLIENEVVPCYYDRDEHGIPRDWVARMRNSIRVLGAAYNSHRMLLDYILKYYLKAADLGQRLTANAYAGAKELTEWRQLVRRDWDKIEIVKVQSPVKTQVLKGHELKVTAWVRTNDFKPEELVVEVCYGLLDTQGRFEEFTSVRMNQTDTADGVTVFEAIVPCTRGGRHGYAVRVLPGHQNLAVRLLPGLVKWG